MLDNLGSDSVFVSDLRIDASIGIYPQEQAAPQPISVDFTLGLPSNQAFRSDDIRDTIDYAQAADAVRQLAVSRHFNLVEYLAQSMADLLIRDFHVSWVRLRIAKLRAMPDGAKVGVNLSRSNPAMTMQHPRRQHTIVARRVDVPAHERLRVEAPPHTDA